MGEILDKIKKYFPIINEPELIAAIEDLGQVKEVAAGNTIMEMGSYIKVMPLVTKGAIKVLREDNNGDELFLYFLYPGQSCAMTVQCCMSNTSSQVRAVAEDDTEYIAIPIEVLDDWMRQYNSWKNFILTTYSARFTELLHTIDSVVFNQLDERLVEYLQQKVNIAKSNFLNTTHQDIAYDLHSTREVISRLLKQLEKKGIVRLHRNKVEVL